MAANGIMGAASGNANLRFPVHERDHVRKRATRHDGVVVQDEDVAARYFFQREIISGTETDRAPPTR